MDLPLAESQRSDMDYRNKRYCHQCNHFKPIDEFEVHLTRSGQRLLGGQDMQMEAAQQLCHSCAQTRMPSKKLSNSDEHRQAHVTQLGCKSSGGLQLPSVLETRPDQRHSNYYHNPDHTTASRNSPVAFIDDMIPLRPAKSKEEKAQPGPTSTPSRRGGAAVPTFDWFTHERAVNECQTLWLGLEHSNANLRQFMDKNAELETRNLALLREIVEVQCRAQAAEKEVEEVRRKFMRVDKGLSR